MDVDVPPLRAARTRSGTAASGAAAAVVPSAGSLWVVAVGAFAGTLTAFALSATVMLGAPGDVLMQTLWPALGIAVGIAVRWRHRAGVLLTVASGVFVGSMGVLVPGGWPVGDLLLVAALITLDLVGLALLLGRLGVDRLRQPWEVVHVVWVTAVMALVTALPALLLSRRSPPGLRQAWVDPTSWLSGSVWGVLLFAPVVLTATRPAAWPWRRAPEFLAATGLILAGAYALFVAGAPAGPAVLAVRYAVMVGLVWLAVRFGAAAVAPLTAVVALYGAAPFTAKGVFEGTGADLLAQIRLVQSSSLAVGVTVLLLAVLIDERRRALVDVERVARERRDQAYRLAVLFQQSPTPAARLLVGPTGESEVLEYSLAMVRLVGPPQAQSGGTTLGLGILPEDREMAWSVIAGALSRSEPPSGGMRPQSEVRLRAVDGRIVTVLLSAAAVPAAAGAGHGHEVVVHAVDITARRQAEQALAEHALTDAVTGLPNRHALHDRLATALHHLGREPGLVGVLFCDLDQFKQINDTLGHQAGDLLLKEVSARLAGAVRSADTVARLGGDEFVVLCDAVHDPEELESLAQRVKDELRGPWVHQAVVFHPTVSVGVAFTSDPEVSGHELLRRADVAMYRAKDAGRDRIEVYQQSADDQQVRAVATQQRVRWCLDHDGLVLHYQPVVDLRDGQVIAAEALVRMRDPDGGLIMPADFLPDAEASGLIAPLGEWVLERAFADLREWRRRGKNHALSVNVSARQLGGGGGFSRWLLDQADASGVDPADVRLEITDSVLMQHGGDARIKELLPLQRAGVSIALDHFGPGYFSFGWLTELPIDIVKVDGSFTRQLGIERRSTSITAALLNAADDFGLTVTAEGVETARQRELLLDMGCREGQGFLLGRPVLAGDASWGDGAGQSDAVPAGSGDGPASPPGA